MPSFYLDTAPVSNAAYAEFIAAGGYDDARWWTPEGWDHRQRAGRAIRSNCREDGDTHVLARRRLDIAHHQIGLRARTVRPSTRQQNRAS